MLAAYKRDIGVCSLQGVQSFLRVQAGQQLHIHHRDFVCRVIAFDTNAFTANKNKQQTNM